MSKHARPFLAQVHGGRQVTLPAAMVQDIIALSEAGRWEELESRARVAATRYPAHLLGWKVLGAAQIRQGKFAQALTALTKVTTLAPADAGAHNDLGVALGSLGRTAEAVQSYRRGLQADARHAPMHSNLGMLLSQLGDLDQALLHLEQALDIQPLVADSHNNLGTVYRDLGRPKDAEAAYRRALELKPEHLQAWVNLGMTQAELERFDEAQASYRRALALQPDFLPALTGLGGLLRRFGDKAEAITCLQRCIALAPAESDAYVELGNVYLELKDIEQSDAFFQQAQQLRPLITWSVKKQKADFSVVLLDTPGASCTPIDYLLGAAPYDRHFYCVTRTPSPHIALLRAKGDVVFNLLADADNGADILPFAAALADLIGRPVVNHPRLVLNSGRDAVAKRLAGMALCRVPKTLRFAGSVLKDAAVLPLDGLAMPLLVRPTGKHGGDEFEKFEDLQAIADFAAARADADAGADFYVTEYADYRSDDGFFRKYRFIAIDGALFPYHLAIHTDWKVHHFRTDMARQAWMRDEEAAFLAAPEGAFDPPRLEALRTMATTIGLDYCGLDVALDREGRVVLFETNAAMLVHDEKSETFAYKNPYIQRIKAALDAMLARRVTPGRSAVSPA